jgi:hypothetical protein
MSDRSYVRVLCAVALTACGSSQPGPHCATDSSGGRGCGCSFSSSPNDFTCTPAQVKNGACCADPGWPNPTEYCDCYYPPTCAISSSGACYCDVRNMLAVGDTPVASCSPPSGHVCCQSNDTSVCGCGSTACGSDEHQVNGCPDPSAPPCYPGKIQVSSCSSSLK